MVFTISNHNDSTSNIVLLGKTFRSQINGISYIGALCLNQTRGDILQEHLGRNVIAGNRQLHKRIACKNNQSNLVIGKIINQIFYQHLTLIKTGRNNILCQHRVGDIQTNDSFNTLSLIMRNLATHLRTSQHDNQECQCWQQQTEFHGRTVFRNTRHQLFEKLRITQLLQLCMSPPPSYQSD